MQYFILNKPAGCITSRKDFRDRPTVYDHVPAHFPQLPHVGRLDFHSEGLLLFTDDGRLAQALLNKEFAGNADPQDRPPIEKEYHVKVKGHVAPDSPVLRWLERPLEFEEGRFTSPAQSGYVAPRSGCTWISLTITEGRTHQIRKLCKREGLRIRKLRRVRLGPLSLGDLKIRWCRELTAEEVQDLYRVALPAG